MEEIIHDEPIVVSRRAERRKKSRSKKMRKIKLTKISHIAGWTDEDETHVRRRKNSNLEQCYKRVSNRKVRRYKGDLSDPADYRKVFDLWWTIW